jgi:hypothetical protein
VSLLPGGHDRNQVLLRRAGRLKALISTDAYEQQDKSLSLPLDNLKSGKPLLPKE